MRLLSLIVRSLSGFLVLLLASCSAIEAGRKAPGPSLIDTTISTAAVGEGGWNYYRSSEADLNGDGNEEKIVLAAQVEIARGRPAWSDGHNWQVYVQSPAGERTLIYAQRLQLGTVTLRLTEQRSTADILLIEHLPDHLAVYQVRYIAPGETKAHRVLSRQLDPRGDLASPRFP